MRDLVEDIETAGSGEAKALAERGNGHALVESGKLAEQSRHALDMVAFGTRKLARYEALFGRIVAEIGRFADAARRERAQLEGEVKALRQELAALRKEHAAAEKSLIDSQLDCWALRMRIQAMLDARTMFDGLQVEQRRERPADRVIDLD